MFSDSPSRTVRAQDVRLRTDAHSLTSISIQLENDRQRLAYYQSQQERFIAQASALLAAKKGPRKLPTAPASITNWIEIYSERVQKLERQIARLKAQALREASDAVSASQPVGLKTQLSQPSKKRASKRGRRA